MDVFSNLVQESTLLKNPSRSRAVLDPVQMRSMIKRFRTSNISAYPPTSPLKNPLPYGGTFFSKLHYCISDCRFWFLIKKYLHKVPFFFQYSIRKRVKNNKKRVFTHLFELTFQFCQFCAFLPCSHQKSKKRDTLYAHFFTRNLNLQSEL